MRHKVYIAGPITIGDRNTNVEIAVSIYRWLIEAGYTPFCPHLSCYAEDKHGCHFAHGTWIAVCLPWVASSDLLLRIPGASYGADQEVEHANELGIPVVTYRGEVGPEALARTLDWYFDGSHPVRSESAQREGDPRFHAELDRLRDLHDRKQQDYGRGEDPLANLRASAELGIPPWVGTMVRMRDKFSRVCSLIRNGALKNEPIEDSFDDIAVYAMLAKILYRETQSA